MIWHFAQYSFFAITSIKTREKLMSLLYKSNVFYIRLSQWKLLNTAVGKKSWYCKLQRSVAGHDSVGSKQCTAKLRFINELRISFSQMQIQPQTTLGAHWFAIYSVWNWNEIMERQRRGGLGFLQRSFLLRASYDQRCFYKWSVYMIGDRPELSQGSSKTYMELFVTFLG